MPIERFRGDWVKLGEWCKHEYQLSLMSAGTREARFLEWQRLYDAKPKTPFRVWPWVGASNLEVPLAKTHSATVESRIEDAYFGTSPWTIVKSTGKQHREGARALSRWINEVELVNANYKEATKHTLLSTVKFGSGFKHLQWKRQITQVYQNGRKKNVVHHDGPMVYYLHPNNVFYPYNTQSIQNARWFGYRTFKPWGELVEEFYEGHYTRDAMEQIRKEGKKLNDPFDSWRHFRNRGEVNFDLDLWEIVTMFAFYQEKDMELPQNLWITFHYPSGVILEAFYNPLLHYQRPIFKADYMIEDGRFWGIGIVGLLEMLQNEQSDVHNYRIDNMFLANTVLFAGKKNAFEKFEFAPMSQITTLDDPNKVIRFERPGEIYPSITGAEDIANAYAERLTGVGDANIPRLGSFRGAAGVRTPATTTLALIGEGNKRFTVAIGNAKDADNELLKQFVQLIYQFWPRRRGDCFAWNSSEAEKIDELFGSLSPRAFARNIAVEVAASTSAVNKEAERQNVLILSEIMIEIFGYLIQLNTLLMQQPQMAPIVNKAYDTAIIWTTMLLETFDVRDPEQYLPPRGDIGSASGSAEQTERGQNLGSSFVRQGLRNVEQGTFSNGRRGGSVVASSQNQGTNGRG